MSSGLPPSQHGPSDGIAVIGLAGRFPGADDASAFWDLLARGASGVTSVVPNERSHLPDQPNYVGKAAVVRDADYFDAPFFGIYPKQAIDMDPQHRLFLEVCWQAMEDAGYVPDAAPGQVGVFAGCHMNTYIFTRLAADAELREALADSFPGGSLTAEISNDKDYIATRVAYQLNLRGPSVNVQSACSTSLVAIAQACENLISGACDMALAGGVTVTFPQQQGYLHTEDSILSPDGTCRTFDAQACGTIFGDGVGAVVLKRLADAVADRDAIYAVLRGWGVSNDGHDKQGYTAPSVSGQAAAIRRAHRRAGITADSISYIEAHGTGTLVGDPIEIEALTQAFRETTNQTQFCRIGSLKTNVGHLDVAAGVSGVIKTALALQHRQIPPVLNFAAPNPKIDFKASPFIVNTELTAWDDTNLPRRAGVSAFGVGGTNAHVVLEQAPEFAAPPSQRPFHWIRLSAQSPVALDQMSDDLAQHFEDHPQLNLADACYTLQTGRKTFRHKRIVVAADLQEAATALRSRGPQQAITADCRASGTAVTFMFPGQGSQHLLMARQLYQSEPLLQQHIDACAAALQPHLNLDLRDLVFSNHGTEANAQRLHQTEIAQPALFMVSYALGCWWQSLGVTPSCLIGHSVGEFAAAAIAGVMSMPEAARLVALRGRLMQTLPGGSMLAVQLPESSLQAMLPDDLEIAAVNGPAFCVVSGENDAIDAFAQQLEFQAEDEPIACRKLHTSHAFHSRMMDAAIAPFEQHVREVSLQAPTIPIVSSVTGQPMQDATATDPAYWARQIREPVRFSAALSHILETSPEPMVLLEVGPNQALSTLARQHDLDTPRQQIVSSLPHAKQTVSDAKFALTSLGQLWQAGVTIDAAAIYSDEPRTRLNLPTYRFQRQRYSFETELQDRRAPSPPAPTTHAERSPEPPANGGTVTQQVIEQQMQLMQQQIQLLNHTRKPR